VVIRSPHFAGMSKVQMHQAIYRVLGDEFSQGLHALAIDAGTGA
jgi:stress-induced morphogen